MYDNRQRTYTPNRRRRRRHSGLGALIRMVLAVGLIVMVVVFCVKTFANRTPSADVFCEGVSVNGTSLAGLTYDEGVQLVENSVKDRLEHASYTLTYQGQAWTFTPADFDAKLDLEGEIQLAWNFGHVGSDSERRASAEYLKQNPVNYEKEITFDEVKLEDFLEQVKTAVDVEPVSASVIVGANEMLSVTQSQNGLRLSTKNLRKILTDAIYAGTATSIELTPDVVKPDYSTEDLQANTVKIVAYQTTLKGSSSQRNKNVWRALSRFNGFVVKPGEKVSFNEIVGKRTVENGFFEAKEFDGSSVIDGVGGGTCQASSTLYGALLYAGIDVDIRSNHSMAVNYCKASLDAAVSDSGKDLVFTNNLEYPIYIYTAVDADNAYVNIYGPPSVYDIVVDSEKTQVIEPKGYKTEKDDAGKYAYYTDDLVLKSEGKNGGKSYAYRDYYDKTTGELVEHQVFATDTYMALKPTYYVGIHSMDEEPIIEP